MKITRKQLKYIIKELLIKEVSPDLATVPYAGKGDDTFLQEVLEKVISGKAGGGKSKNYDDLFHLDGGTVGIAHFAARGLGSLYDAMGDTIVKNHFGQHKSEINSVQALKDATRVGSERDGYCRLGSAKAVEGTCWASMPWWKEGFKSFLSSNESKDVQNRAWKKVTVEPADNLMDSYGENWHTKRGRAIGYCLVNSGGPGLLKKFSKSGKNSPNETMEAYNRDKGRVRSRFRILNKLYPDPNFIPSFKPDSYKQV